MKKHIIPAAIVLLISISACNDQQKQADKTVVTDSSSAAAVNIKTENVEYTGDGVTMKGFVAYNESLSSLRPVVLIVPEWWGISDYTRNRAKQLAELGFLAFAIDMYGDGKTAETPEEAQKLSASFYSSVKTGTSRFEAAMAKIKTYPNADTSRIAAIGYCFGGAMVLNMARVGQPLKGVVSFHGNLIGAPADKKLLKADVLVCHGGEDSFVPPTEVAAFKKQMDSIGAVYTFKNYPGATHAFTNPNATEKGKKYNLPIEYNVAADTASFNEMKLFFNKIFK
ncbi:MAG: dienelactone hydrolase family protein [Ferruginibacter sp.]